MKYAQLLKIIHGEDYSKVVIADPWHKNKTLHTYFLVKTDSKANRETLRNQGTVVTVPLRRSMPFTTVHSEMICTDFCVPRAIAGVADLQYIKVRQVIDGVRAGWIADCGNSMQPDIEKIIDTDPDAIFVSPFENSGGYGKLESLGIPIIECADYMEVGPLARVEWLKFYGMLFGVENKADSIIGDVCARYNTIKEKASAMKTYPTVLMDKLTGGTWYVPGGNSTTGIMLADAGADYFYKTDKSEGSLPLSFEKVLDDASDADIWLTRYSSPAPLTYSLLLSENRGYSQFAAFKKHNIYGCNVETTRFYEETPFHPDLLLQDIYQIMSEYQNPGPDDIQSQPSLHFFKKLQ